MNDKSHEAKVGGEDEREEGGRHGGGR